MLWWTQGHSFTKESGGDKLGHQWENGESMEDFMPCQSTKVKTKRQGFSPIIDLKTVQTKGRRPSS